MTLKQKILISNIIMVCVPILVAFLILIGYTVLGRDTYINPVNTGNNESSCLSAAQNALYMYETEISKLEWESVKDKQYSSPDYLPTPEMLLISELADMGYHMNVVTDGEIFFDNLSADDRNWLADYKAKHPLYDGSLEYVDSKVIIRDTIEQFGSQYEISAIYDKSQADSGVQQSLLPVYMISTNALIAALFLLLACIIMVNFLLIQWLDRSILEPLSVLKKASRQISGGNFNIALECDSKDEFGEVFREFDSMKNKLKDSATEQEIYYQQRRQMLRGISHDLRLPLTSIKGYAEGLKDGIAGTEQKKQQYYDAILTRAVDVERLLDSLSVLVRLDDPGYHYQLERVNIDEFLHQFIQEESIYAEQNAITIIYQNADADLDANIDIRELRRVFINLMENTVKYRTKEKSLVRLSVQKSTDGKMVEIIFADDGPGVAARHLDNIFDSFFRADESRTKPESGSGLGLAVVKSIVEGHEGYVRAYIDNGLSVLIALPLFERRI